MAKKKSRNNKIYENVGSFDGSTKNIIITITCILCFFAVFYLLTIYITNKNSDSSNNEQTTETSEDNKTISYEDIMIGRSFSMSDDEYLVLYYDKSDEKLVNTYSSLVSQYKVKENHLNIYCVDMSNSFNKEYATVGEANKSPATESDILINGPTLIKVSDRKASLYLEGEEAISNYLK